VLHVSGVRERPSEYRRPRRGARGLTAGAALAASSAAHAVVAVTVGGIIAASRPDMPVPAPAPQDSIQVELAPTSNVVAPAPEVVSPSPPPPRRAGSAAAPHRRAVATRSVSAPAAPSPAAVVEAPQPPVPRFVMAAGTVATRAPAPGPAPAPAAPSASAGAAGAAGAVGATEVAGEGEVDAPARPLSWGLPVYPPAARQAEIESDVPVEIVVDTDGRVISARPLSRVGYGLDDAALGAIRAYRFSPAVRGGRPVRVRMRWTVHFRLR
jgi:protein TonB